MTDEISNNGVVVTGMGLVTPIGVTVETFWSSLLEGRCGIGPVEGVEGEHLGLSVAAQIKDYDPRTPLKAWQRDKTILHSDRYSWLAAAAARQGFAIDDLAERHRQAGQADNKQGSDKYAHCINSQNRRTTRSLPLHPGHTKASPRQQSSSAGHTCNTHNLPGLGGLSGSFHTVLHG